jgi:hypothetical protein
VWRGRPRPRVSTLAAASSPAHRVQCRSDSDLPCLATISRSGNSKSSPNPFLRSKRPTVPTPWAQLFRESPDYRGTELVRDLDHPGRYLTLDHWASREALHRFKQDYQSVYAALDKQCESLTEKEMFLGDFEHVALRPNT